MFTLTSWYIDGLVQDCSNSSVSVMELLQFCTHQYMSIYFVLNHFLWCPMWSSSPAKSCNMWCTLLTWLPCQWFSCFSFVCKSFQVILLKYFFLYLMMTFSVRQNLQTHGWVKLNTAGLNQPCPTLQWHHNECDGISNHQSLSCLLNQPFV